MEIHEGRPMVMSPSAVSPRKQLLSGIAVTERRLQVAGISTAVIEGGDGPPVVLLHGPGEFAAKWMRILPDLITTHHVIAPDLPGHGESRVLEGPLDAEHVLTWLGELIDRTCAVPPVLVGHILGGAIAARFAAAHGDRIRRLVLVDSLGLGPFRPAPRFALALLRFTLRPTERAHEGLWRRCASDLDRLRDEMGEKWEPFKTYNIDRAQDPGVKAALKTLMGGLGIPAISEDELARIAVPTALIWGRLDLANRLQIGQNASKRYGWPLHVVENSADDPALEQPEAFLRALRSILDES